MYANSARLHKTSSVLNRLPAERIKLIVNCVVDRICERKKVILNDSEKENILSSIQVTWMELRKIIDGVVFIFENAAYDNSSCDALSESLSRIGLSQSLSQIFIDTWQVENKKIISSFVSKMISGPRSLIAFSWNSSMIIAQTDASKLKCSSTIFTFTTSASEEPEDVSQLSFHKSFAVEFSHGSLFAFFSKLEIIQEQLDTLC